MGAGVSVPVRKLRTLTQVLRAGGLRGAWGVVAGKGFDWNPEWIGRLVELGGNRVALEGCVYDVGDPKISRAIKGSLWANRYEHEMRDVIHHAIDWSLPLVELGGSLGVVSCICNRRLVNPEQHVVVEANPALVPLLERARAGNGARFTILPRALGYGNGGAVEFHPHPTSTASGTLIARATGAVPVETISLGEILDRFGFGRACVICDIEGTEVELVDREEETLAARVKVLIVEWHDFMVGQAQGRDARARLEAAGFEAVYERGIVSAWVNRNL